MKHSWELNILSMLSPSRKARNHLKFHGELPHSESEQIYYYNKLTAEAALLFLRWLLLLKPLSFTLRQGNSISFKCTDIHFCLFQLIVTFSQFRQFPDGR